MGDVGDLFNDMRRRRKETRAKYGVPCPVCQKLLPKAHPSILLPGQRCRIHNYSDPRGDDAYEPDDYPWERE